MHNHKNTKQGIRDLSDLFTDRHAEIREPIPDSPVPSPQIFNLLVSYNCGLTYTCCKQGTEEQLKPLMKIYDDNMFRWYTEAVTGEKQVTHISRIHSRLLALLKILEAV